jgi:predicted GNAT superfamily acetyltransferase
MVGVGHQFISRDGPAAGTGDLAGGDLAAGTGDPAAGTGDPAAGTGDLAAGIGDLAAGTGDLAGPGRAARLTAARAEAAEAARAAAAASRVRVRGLGTLAEVQQVCALYDEIWRPEPGSRPVTVEFLRALAHSGNYVCGAFAGDELVGACAGFFASPAGVAMHSHIAGVSDRVRGRHVGFALKLHQRAWALARGVELITWTFDPLISRNAYFNLGKLGACATEYLPDFYGAIDDGFNSGDDTDRLLVSWPLADAGVSRACQGRAAGADAAALRAAGAAVALDTSPAGLPAPPGTGSPGVSTAGSWPPGAGTALVRVPDDIDAVRRGDSAAARRWRGAVREVLGGLLAGGGQVTGFDRSGWYVVERGRPAAEEAL